MHRFVFVGLIMSITVAATPIAVAAESNNSSAAEWYAKSYAPIWNDQPAERLDEIAVFYAETIQSHGEDGVSTANSREWLGSGMTLWASEGWLRSSLVNLKTDVLNPSTAVFKARWRDWYENADPDDSCGWYLADRIGGAWQFSHFADIDCEAHGL